MSQLDRLPKPKTDSREIPLWFLNVVTKSNDADLRHYATRKLAEYRMAGKGKRGI